MSYSAGNLNVEFFGIDKSVINTLDNVITRFQTLGKLTTQIKKTNSTYGSNSKKSAFGFLDATKWGISIYMARRLGRYVGKIVQYGADYTETLNLWETAMGDNITLATQFINKMNEAYGISEKTLMNAQAIFKNMLGSLGQISDSMAYSLSEGITQMALDYASLYNVKFTDAFTKFQAALAGQVRPIRSVSGYDITENTLFQLYQSLGGTKSMRQLSRTEKQLLSILAIFNQMTASGAVGDLDKTMESFANQSRVMAEAWQRVLTYAGTLLTYTIQESGLLTYVNATLLFIGDTLKVLAESMGAIQSFGGNIFEETTDGALATSDAIDKVTGKLLDFDKFRALNSKDSSNILGLDEKLLQALSGYSTILNDANMQARILADNWLKLLGVTRDENGELVATDSALSKIKNTINAITIAFGLAFGLTALSALIKFGSFLKTYALTPLISLAKWLFTAQTTMAGVTRAFAVGTMAFLLFDDILGNLNGTARKTVSALFVLLGSIVAIKGALKGGLVGASVSALGIGAVIAGIKNFANIDFYAKGASNIDGGSVFVAGEMGRTEMVYSGANGKSNVANVAQIEQATYNALVRFGQTNKNQPIVVYLDGEKVFENTTLHAHKRGLHWR